MATYTAATYAFDMSVTANYQALMGDIDSKIQSLGGWTYVAQTGDGNPASTSPGANGTYPAFRCYSTTSGATTWYLRIDYGHTAAGPSIKVQIGTAINGSGVLSGQTCTQLTLTCSNTSASQSLHMSAATGRLMIFFALAGNSAGAQAAFSLHGSVDGSGNTNGGMELFSSINTTFTAQYVPSSGSIPAQFTAWPAAMAVAASYAVGGAVPLFPPILWDSTGANNPTLAVFKYGTSDLTSNTSTSVSLYSASRTFIVSPMGDANLSTNQKAAYRYD